MSASTEPMTTYPISWYISEDTKQVICEADLPNEEVSASGATVTEAFNSLLEAIKKSNDYLNRQPR